MRRLNIRNKSKKSLFLSVLLLVVILGVSGTIALAVAKTGPVINRFKVGKIDTGIKEEVDASFNKKVTVKNAKETPAYVRVRLNIPKGITPVLPGVTDGTWADGGDGFYYYLYSLGQDEISTMLLEKLEVPEGYNKSFDVTVYQEACIATKENPKAEGNNPLTVAEIKEAFAEATGTTHTAE